jgi:hypothetical protein
MKLPRKSNFNELDDFSVKIDKQHYLISIKIPKTTLNTLKNMNITLFCKKNCHFNPNIPPMLQINPKHKGEVSYVLDINNDVIISNNNQKIKFIAKYIVNKKGVYKTKLKFQFSIIFKKLKTQIFDEKMINEEILVKIIGMVN